MPRIPQAAIPRILAQAKNLENIPVVRHDSNEWIDDFSSGCESISLGWLLQTFPQVNRVRRLRHKLDKCSDDKPCATNACPQCIYKLALWMNHFIVKLDEEELDEDCRFDEFLTEVGYSWVGPCPELQEYLGRRGNKCVAATVTMAIAGALLNGKGLADCVELHGCRLITDDGEWRLTRWQPNRELTK